MPDRSEAWELLCEYTKGDSLRKHAIAVETAMRASAKKYGDESADVDEWGLVGLLQHQICGQVRSANEGHHGDGESARATAVSNSKLFSDGHSRRRIQPVSATT